MKRRILFLTSLLCMCGAAVASECSGTACEIDIAPGGQSDVVVVSDASPMVNVKLLSVKPAPMDARRPLWDGTDGEFTGGKYTKTVSGRDGAPLWDDAIVSYRDKDFSDWYLENQPIVWKSDLDAATARQDIDITKIYEQNMADAAETLARVEELLQPMKPSANLWTNDNITVTNDKIAVIDTTIEFSESDGCPFESDAECEIWRRKPMVHETVSPRSAKIRDDKMSMFIGAARMNPNICASADVAAPLLARYKMLMRAANSCCVDGLVYKLKDAGASDGLVYKFLADDANFYGLGSRCLMTTDAELDAKYPNTATAAAAADVRNGCLCRGREWFRAMLAPFVDAYAAAPEFKDAAFNYTYTDGLGRDVTTSINTDVQNVLKQLSNCP